MTAVTVVTLAAVLSGLGTYYDPALDGVYRSGEMVAEVDPAEVCAVDASMWSKLAGEKLLVCSVHGCAEFRVADTGRLRDAGKFRYSPLRGFRVRSDRRNDPHIVLDIPREGFRRISPNLDTVRILAWRVSAIEERSADESKRD